MCAGLYEADDAPTDAPDKGCTHGPDIYEGAAPAGEVSAASTSGPTASSIPCYGTGPYVRVLYLYSGTNYLDAASPKAQRPLIRESIGLVDKMFKDAAAAASKVRHVRWKMSSCKLTVTSMKMDTNTSVFTMRSRLVNAGKMSTSEKGLAFIEGMYCGGFGEVRDDDRATSSNQNNSGGMLAVLGTGCFASRGQSNSIAADVAAHELLHTLGAVQDSAPRSTRAWHCYDEWDTMCYDDGGPRSTMTYKCAKKEPEIIDCGKNDYFNANPTSGSYLGTHWNTAKSRFLVTYNTSAADTLARPTVGITSPTKGGTIAGKATITASASAPSGSTVRWVDFYVGSTLIKTDTSSPYSATLDTNFDGTTGYRSRTTLSFKARVVDSYYRTKTSSTISAVVDNPTVRLTSPGTSQAISGLASWSATAAAGAGRTVDRVWLYLNDAWHSTDTTAPYGGTFNTAPYATGSTLKVRVVVKDSGGATRSSVNRDVVIVRPSATLTSNYVSASGPVRLAAATEIPAGSSLARVDFLVDDVIVGSDDSAPYAATWDPDAASTPDGYYPMTVVAVDSSGVGTTDYSGNVELVRTIDSVLLNAPTEGAVLSGSSIPVTAAITLGDPGTWNVYSVTFYVDGYQSGYGTEDSPGVYSGTIDTTEVQNGPHIVQAVLEAYSDTEFASTYSLGTLIEVNNPEASAAFTAPANGATVKGAAVALAASVTDVPSTQVVSYVQFAAEQADIDYDYDSPYTVAWDSRLFADGPVTLYADATIGSYQVSGSRTVNLANTAATVTSPTAGATLTGTRTFTVSTTKDGEAIIEWVRVYIDGVNRCHDGTATSGSYSCSWSTTGLSNGPHSVQAKISTTDGRTIWSPAVSVTVSN